MWNRPLFRNGVIFGLAGVLLFRICVALTIHFFTTLPKRSGLKPVDPPLILILLNIGLFLMALGGVIAIVTSLILGDKNESGPSKLR